MLAVAGFIVFWILVGLGVFLLAARGRNERRAAAGPSRSGSRGYIALFVVTAAVFGVGLPLLMLTGNHSNASAQVEGYKLTASEKHGRELFGEHCAVCHTLAAANADGKVGPNLDLLRPSASIVLHTINNGCLPDPTAGSQEACLGQGVMPADVVEGDDAVDVAMFVARVTGSATSTSSAGSSASASSSTTSTSSSTTSTSSSAAAAAPSSGKATTLMLAANKTGLLAYDTKTLSAKAGKVTIDFTNASPLPHNVTVQLGTSGPTIAATPTFQGGTKSITMTLKPGTYTYYCSVPGHRQAGMVGTLTVTAGTSSSTASSSAKSKGKSSSGKSKGKPSSAAAAPSSGKATTLMLAANKTGLLAYDTKTLSAKAGKVTIDFTNASPLPHNVTVQLGTSGPTIAATPTFQGGTKSITMTLKPGTYTYYCSVPGHRQAGMVGTLTVR